MGVNCTQETRMKDKEPSYHVFVSWKQEYTEWDTLGETINEIELEQTEFTEAKVVIDRIRAMK